jgi:CRP/FNR family transcriptional regulator
MYSQTGASAARSTIHSPIGPADPKPTLKDLFAGRSVESFSAGEALIWEGDQGGQISDVLEGVLRVYKILPDGRRAIMGFVYPGETRRTVTAVTASAV